MKVNYILKRLSVVFFMLFIAAYSYGQSVSATYTTGNIGTEYNSGPTTAAPSACPGLLTVTVPSGAIISGVDVVYSMTAFNGAWLSEQMSYVKCLSTGGTAEAAVTNGPASNIAGTEAYSRTGLSIANGVTGGGNIDFQLNGFRSYGGSACDTLYQYVVNGTWTVTVNYFMPTALDVGLSNLMTSTAAFPNQPVTVDLDNFGTTTVTSATINWDIDGVAQTPVSWTGSLAQFATANVALGNANFTAGAHTVTAIVSAPNAGVDQSTGNDTIVLTQTYSPALTLPYFQSFDVAGTPTQWSQYAGTGGPWVFGSNNVSPVPGYDNASVADHTGNGGLYTWMDFSSTDVGVVLESPEFYVAANNVINIEFYMWSWYASSNTDANWLYVESYNGTNWIVKDSIYQNFNGWVLHTYDLSAEKYGNSSKFRFRAESGGTSGDYYNDILIDDVRVFEPQPNDMIMISWDAPLSGTAPSATMPVGFTFRNGGTVAQDSFALMYSVDGGTTYTTEMYNMSVAATDTVNYMFTATANMATPGYYDMIGIVSNTGDSDNSNDTVWATEYLCSALTGTYSIGPDVADDFNSFSDAAFALENCGIVGAVTFNVDSGIYNEQVLLGTVTGASATNTITFQSVSGNAADVMLWYAPTGSGYDDNYVFKLNGAQYVTIQDITVKAESGSSTNGRCITLHSGAAYNQVKNNVLYSTNAAGSGTAGIYLRDATSMMNVFSGNMVDDVYYGIYLYGSNSSTLGYGNVVAGNTVTSKNYGIYCYYQDSVSIMNNNLYSHSTSTNYYGFYGYYSKGAFKYVKNNILAHTTSTFYGFYMSNNDATAGNEGLVANNMINQKNTGTTSTNYGLYFTGTDYVNCYFNTVAVGSNSTSARALYQTSGSNLSFMNNNFVYKGTGSGYAAYYSTTSAVLANDYNNYYSTGSNFTYWGGAKADLAALQTASLMDLGSQSIAPNFLAVDDLHHYTILLNNLGSPIAGFTDDIDGDLRDPATPDIGADEYTPLANDMVMLEWIAPMNGMAPNAAAVVSVKVTNQGTATQSNVPVKYSIDGGATYVTEAIPGPIFTDDTLTYNFTLTANLGTFGVYNAMAFTDVVGEQNAANDTVFYDFAVCGPITGIYTLGMDATDDFSSLADFALAVNSCGITGPVTLNVDSGMYYGYATFYPIMGASATNTITIQSASGNAEDVVIENNIDGSPNWVIGLDTADHFSIKNMTLKNTKATNAAVITIRGGADYNLVYGNILESMPGSLSSNRGINDNNGNDHMNVYRKNTIMGGYYGIYARGQGSGYGSRQMGTIIDSNDISGFHLYGIYAYYNDSIQITNNKIYGGVNTYGYGIYNYYCNNDFKVTNNTYIGTHSSYSYGYYGGYGNRASYNASNNPLPGLVANNSFAIDGGTGSSSGIYSYYENVVKYYNNSVSINSAGTGSEALYYYNSSSNPIGPSFVNNAFANYGGGKAAYFSTTNYFDTIAHNNYYNQTGDLAYWSGNKADLAALKAANGQDSNSVSVDPFYFAMDDLRTVTVNDAGTPLPEVMYDIDGNMRDLTAPDIGAYEYNIPTVDLGADMTVCVGDSVTFMANTGTDYMGWSYLWTNGVTNDTLPITTAMLTTDTAGTYNVEVMHPQGYTITDVVTFANFPVTAVSFTGLNANYCENDAAALLVGTPTGGDFYIDGVMATASFDPMTVGTGSHMVEYYFTDLNGCTNSDMMTVMVNPNPTADAGMDVTICEGDTATLTVNANMVMADLFFSEYIEGSSNNKAIEIYNGTGATVNLDDYRIAQAVNGGGWAYYHTFPVGATLADGATWTIITNQVDTTMFAHSGADEVLSYPSVVHHNGDDARGLEKTMDAGATWTLIDLIGDPNNDPGSGWDVAGVTNGTQNHTMIRKSDVYGGNVNWAAAAGMDSLSSEWMVYPINTFTNLGLHTMTGTAPTFTYLWSTTETTQSIMVNPTATTDYSVVATNGFGCMAYDTVMVMVNPNPVVNLGPDTALCMSEFITLDAGAGFASYLWSTGETTQSIVVDGTAGSGTVSVTVVDSNACSGMDDIMITFNALPNINLGNDTIICENYGKLTLDLGTGFVAYLWSTGASTQTIELDADTMTLGTSYTIVGGAMDANGCMNADTIVVTVDPCTGIDDNNGDLSLSIMPNPSNGQFTLKANGIEGDVNVDIMSVNGQVIFSEVIESLNSSTIVKGYDLSTYAKGVYFMRLTNKAGVRTERVVIQ